MTRSGGRLHEVILGEIGWHDVTRVSIEDRLGSFHGLGHETRADVLAVEPELELGLREERQRNAGDDEEVVRLVHARQGESNGLSTILWRGFDSNDGVFAVPIA